MKVLCLFWAGLAFGISFVATPAKFLTPSLKLQTAVDVGRHVFATSHAVQLVLAAIALLLVLAPGVQRRFVLGACAVLVVQHLVLLPLLDARALAIIAGESPHAPSPHLAYVALEAIKIGALLAAGGRRHAS